MGLFTESVSYKGIVFMVDPGDHAVGSFETHLCEMDTIFRMIGPLTQVNGYPLEFIDLLRTETYPIVMYVNKTPNSLKYTLLGVHQRTVPKLNEFVVHMSKPAPSVKPAQPPKPNSLTTNSWSTRTNVLKEKVADLKNRAKALLPKPKEKLHTVSGEVLSSAASDDPLKLLCTKMEPDMEGDAPRYMCTEMPG